MPLLSILLLLALASTSFGADPSFTLTADANTICASIPANCEGAALVRCHACEYYPTTPFLREYDGVGDDCQTDGYDQDRAYYRPNDVCAFVEKANAASGERIEIERFSAFDADRGRDKIYDRFYLIKDAQISRETGFAAGGEILAGPIFPYCGVSLNTEPREERASIKGLEAFDLDDARELGCAHAAMTVDLCWLLQTENVETIEFEYGGKTLRFNKQAVAYYDAWAKRGSDYEMELTFVLVFWGHRLRLVDASWIFPDYELWSEMPYTLSIAAPNTTCLEGIDRLRGLYEFLAARYTRQDRAFGRVSNFVIGNELNSGYIWNNMGKLSLGETVRQYERQLRIAYTAFHKYWTGANVLASLDNYWTKNSSVEFGQTAYVDKGGFSGKEFLCELARVTREEGDYPWAIAYHPYGLDLRSPVYWDQYSTEQAEKSLDAPRITPYNCEILARFLATEPALYRPNASGENERQEGVPREFYFTEQGFASPQDDNYGEYNDEAYDPEALPQVWLDRQCAALALAFYKAQKIGAKAYIVHRQFDVKSERLNIGLWARPKDKESGMAVKKPVWFMYRDIDKEGSKKENEKFLWMLRFYPHEDPPTSWEELLE